MLLASEQAPLVVRVIGNLVVIFGAVVRRASQLAQLAFLHIPLPQFQQVVVVVRTVTRSHLVSNNEHIFGRASCDCGLWALLRLLSLGAVANRWQYIDVSFGSLINDIYRGQSTWPCWVTLHGLTQVRYLRERCNSESLDQFMVLGLIVLCSTAT